MAGVETEVLLKILVTLTVDAGLPATDTTEEDVAEVTMCMVEGEGVLEELVGGEELDDCSEEAGAAEDEDGDEDEEEGCDELEDVPLAAGPLPSSGRSKRFAPLSQQLKETRSASQQ